MKTKYFIIVLLLLLYPISIKALVVNDCDVLVIVKKDSAIEEDSYICKNKKYGESGEAIYYSGEGNIIELNNFNGYYLTNTNTYDINIDITGNNNISLLHIDNSVNVTITGNGTLKFKEVSYVKKNNNGLNVNSYTFNKKIILDENDKIYEGTIEEFEESYDILKEKNKLPETFNIDDYTINLVNDYTKMTPIVITPTYFDNSIQTTLKSDVIDGFGYIYYEKEEEPPIQEEKKVEVTKKVSKKKKNKLESDNVILISKSAVDSKYKLSVDDLKDKEVAKKVEDMLDNLNLLDFYDISVKNGKKEVSMKNGEYTIKIKIDDKFKDYEDFQIVYVNDDGEVAEYLDATIEDDYIIFKTNHLSQYGIIAKHIEPIIEINEEPIIKKKINYSLIFKISILAIVALSSLIFIIFLIIKSKLLNKRKRIPKNA